MKSIFLTGTDTSAGKTHAAAALMLRYENMRYWKAVQTGYPADDDCAAVRSLTGLKSERFLQTGFAFAEPLSPHRASELEGKELRVDMILEKYSRISGGGNILLEGAGGLIVPINRSETWLDFLARTDLSIVIVARTGLGTINHSLLTIRCLENNGLKPAGIIFCGRRNDDNVRTILEFSGVPYLGQFYYESGMDFKSAAGEIDLTGILDSIL